jgi:hypothetical protein
LEANEKEVLEKGMRSLWIIWVGILGSLCVYIFICHHIGDQIKGDMGSNFPIGTIKHALYLVAIVTLIIAYFFRKRMLSGTFRKSEENISNLKLLPSQAPFLSKYTTAMIVSLALSETIGIYGLVLFFLGDKYQTLYTFIGISAISMFYFRPKKEEIEKLAIAMKIVNMGSAR